MLVHVPYCVRECQPVRATCGMHVLNARRGDGLQQVTNNVENSRQMYNKMSRHNLGLTELVIELDNI